MTRATDMLWKNASDRESFPALGCDIGSGFVWKKEMIAGQHKGAYAQVTDGTRVHRVGDSVAASMVIGPVGLLGALSKRTKAVAVVALANGKTLERKLDGNSAVRRAQAEAVRFNARTQAA